MAEPADSISLATCAGTNCSFSTLLSAFPSLLKNFLNLFQFVCIRALPEVNKLRIHLKNKLTVLGCLGLGRGRHLGDELAL